jgi:hypothetical protein
VKEPGEGTDERPVALRDQSGAGLRGIERRWIGRGAHDERVPADGLHDGAVTIHLQRGDLRHTVRSEISGLERRLLRVGHTNRFVQRMAMPKSSP